MSAVKIFLPFRRLVRSAGRLSVCSSVRLLVCLPAPMSICLSARLSVSPYVSQRMYFELLRCKFKKDDASGTEEQQELEQEQPEQKALDSTRLSSKNGKTKGYCDKDLLVCPPTTMQGCQARSLTQGCLHCLVPALPVVIYEFQG